MPNPNLEAGPGRPKGLKNKATLKFEELRSDFNNRVMEKWEVLMNAQLEDSLKNYKARHYTFDQTIGKAKENIELSGEFNLKIDV